MRQLLSHLDGFDGVFHLKKPAFRAERVDTAVILVSRREHACTSAGFDWQDLHTLLTARTYLTALRVTQTCIRDFVHANKNEW
jgi:hypothetical protein